MISVIVVILVGIGFTRLTMLALEMRDEDDLFDSAPAETLLRKEIIIERMRAMKKPRALVITGEDQCKLPEADVIARQEERERENDIFASMYSATPRIKEDEPDEEKGSDLEEPASVIEVPRFTCRLENPLTPLPLLPPSPTPVSIGKLSTSDSHPPPDSQIHPVDTNVE